MFALDINLEGNNLLIQGNFDNCEISNETRGELQFCSVTIEGYASTAEPGKAILPLYSQLISLPPSGNFVIENIKYNYDEVAIDLPIQSFGWEDHIEKNAEFYSKDEWYPKNIVTIGSPVIMRGNRFCQISIAAVQYNPDKKYDKSFKRH